MRSAGGQDAILVWSKTIASQYGVEVKDFGPSWRDGLVLCALVEFYHKGGIGFASLKACNALENLELAFSTAEADGVPRLLDPEDLQVRVPDRRSLVTYLSGYALLPSLQEA